MSPGARIWLAQCLCPQRHCIMGCAAAADERAAEETIAAPLREAVAALLREGTLNPWCGLCKAPAESWRYEVGRTRFRSMAEAMPALKECEQAQRTTAALWGELPRSDRAPD